MPSHIPSSLLQTDYPYGIFYLMKYHKEVLNFTKLFLPIYLIKIKFATDETKRKNEVGNLFITEMDGKTWNFKYVDMANTATIRKYYCEARKADCVIFYTKKKEQIDTIREAVKREYGSQKAKGKAYQLPSVSILYVGS